MERITQGFSVSTVAAAKTIIEDTIDAAFTISAGYYIPTSLEVDVMLDVVASRAAGGTKKYSTQITLHAYNASAVNTTMKDNLASVFTEWGETITDSGLYNTVETVVGSVTVDPDDFVTMNIISSILDGFVLCDTNDGWDVTHDREAGTGSGTGQEYTGIVETIRDGVSRRIIRSFFYFDLSSVSGTITVAQLRIEGIPASQVPGWTQTDTANIIVLKGAQGESLDNDDYHHRDIATPLSAAYTSWVEDTNTIDLNAAGVAYVQSLVGESDWCKLCLEEYDHDFLDVQPDEGQYISSLGYYADHTTDVEKPALLLSS